MLKIKDNIDLKELEKYGFYHEIRHDYLPNSTVSIDDYRIIHLIIYSVPSHIQMEMFQDNVIRAYVDDLEKDNLIEVIEDE